MSPTARAAFGTSVNMKKFTAAFAAGLSATFLRSQSGRDSPRTAPPLRGSKPAKRSTPSLPTVRKLKYGGTGRSSPTHAGGRMNGTGVSPKSTFRSSSFTCS